MVVILSFNLSFGMRIFIVSLVFYVWINVLIFWIFCGVKFGFVIKIILVIGL